MCSADGTGAGLLKLAAGDASPKWHPQFAWGLAIRFCPSSWGSECDAEDESVVVLIGRPVS